MAHLRFFVDHGDHYLSCPEAIRSETLARAVSDVEAREGSATTCSTSSVVPADDCAAWRSLAVEGTNLREEVLS